MTDQKRDVFVEGFGVPRFEPADTPNERLRQVFRKNDLDVDSFEWAFTKKIAFSSFLIGGMFGGLKMASAAEQTWRKTHYHSLFMDSKDAGRYLMNYLARRFVVDGTKFGLRVGLVTGTLALTAGCLAARRDRSRVTDVGIGGAVGSFLYRLDVGPRAMLASGLIGGVFWQLCALSVVPVLWAIGHTWDGAYKETRRYYYEEENGRKRFYDEMKANGEEEHVWPWQMRMRWEEKKYHEEQRLAEARMSQLLEEPEEPATPKVETPPRTEQAEKISSKDSSSK